MVLADIARKLRQLASFQTARADERGYVTYHTRLVPKGGTIALALQNPAGSEVTLDIEQFLTPANFRAKLTIYDQFDAAPSGGSPATIDNLAMNTGGNGGGGEATALEDPDFTPAESHIELATGSGGAAGDTIGGETDATNPLIKSGRDIVIELTNESMEERLGTVGAVFSEETRIIA